ncbi:MAG: phosphoribosylamine--glycine ligase, partial [Oscillospiraceae bacterium]
MNLLVVGSGGREHAIIRKLRESPRVDTIFCAPGNGGISADARCVDIKATDLEQMVAFAQQNAVDFAVVAPDDPLVLGMVDAMNAAGIPAFGPTKAAAAIEGSKVFSKDLMKRYGIPTAAYESFDDPAAAIAYLKAQNRYPAVIKADGLALGKGVIIAESEAEAVEAVRSMMQEGAFGESGRRVVIEEFLTGIEVSVLSFTDGKTVLPMASSMDHKRALDGDQ